MKRQHSKVDMTAINAARDAIISRGGVPPFGGVSPTIRSDAPDASSLAELVALHQGLHEDVMDFGQEAKSQAKEVAKAMSELRVRMMAVEQHVVDGGGNFGPGGGSFHVNSMAELVLNEARNDASFAHLARWNEGTARLDIQAGIRAALTNDGAGTSNDFGYPGNPNRGPMVGEVHRPLTLLDVLPTRKVDTDKTEFVQMTSTGDAAEQEHEGDEKTEVSLNGTLVQANVVTIASWTTASKQVLTDQTALQGEIDRVLRYKCLARLEDQILNGTGGTGKIDGLINQATALVPTIAGSASTDMADRIGESLTRQADAGYSPSVVILNPLDWFEIQIQRTTDNQYLFGSPIMPVAPSLWNSTVVTSPYMPRTAALTIDPNFTTITDREAPSVVVSTSHSNYFVRNLVAILGELRAGLEVLDTAAVYLVDLNES